MRIVLSGGGTAGHINPALAIADTVKRAHPDAEILFLGGTHGLEQDLVTRAGYPITCFPLAGLRRSLSPENIRALWLALRGTAHAKKALRAFAPDVVIGTGGYVCFPVLRAATACGIPTILHESNAAFGVAAKALLSKMDLVLVNYPETLFACTHAKEAICVGNPTRVDYSAFSKKRAKQHLFGKTDLTVLLSFGGSLGAKVLNDEMLVLMKTFTKERLPITIVHVTGKREYDAFLAEATACGITKNARIRIYPYLYNLPEYLAAADLAITRAGAMTLSELALTATPAILIPSPNVTDNHQYKNASVLADAGAAILLPEAELADGKLIRTVKEVFADANLRRRMEKKITITAKPHANLEILHKIESLAQKKQKKH